MNKHSPEIRNFTLWFIFIFGVFSSQKIMKWPLLQVLGLTFPPGFMDLRSILGAVECSRLIDHGDYVEKSFWEECQYIYGSSLNHSLSFLGLSSQDTQWIGWVFIAGISALFAYINSLVLVTSWFPRLGILLCVFSPPMMLLLERANFDVLIVLMVWAAIIFGKKPGGLISVALVGVSALFKFYTLPLALLLLTTLKSSFRKILSVSFLTLVVLKIAQDLTNMQSNIPRYVWNSFGNASLGLYLEQEGVPMNSLTQNFVGYFQLICIFFVLHRSQRINSFLKTPLADRDFAMSAKGRLQVFFIIVFLTCYFFGMSYDYRLIFLVVPGLIEAIRLHTESSRYSWIIALTALISWSTLLAGNQQPFGDLARLQPLGDLCISVLVIYFGRLYFRSIRRWIPNKLRN